MALLGGGLAACATVSLPGRGEVATATRNTDEGNFRRRARAFMQAYKTRGWVQNAGNQGRTQQILSFLHKGWSGLGGKKQEAKTKSVADTYIAALEGVDKDNPAQIAILLCSDLDLAWGDMDDLAKVTEAVIMNATHQSVENLRYDVALSEEALLSATRAQAVFSAVDKKISPYLKPERVAEIHQRLARNEQLVVRLRSATDALNARRRTSEAIG